MHDVFGELGKFFKFDSCKIDNSGFRLHYKMTVMVFTAAAILVASQQYIGDPIDCMVEGVPGGMMDTYCWIHSTFSVPSRWNSQKGVEVPHAGVAPPSDLNPNTEVKYHKWYQWVPFFFCLQIIFFHTTRWLWKSSEAGKVTMLVGELQEPLLDAGKKEEQISEIVKYFRMHRGTHSMYALRFFACEVVNFINVICQIYFIDFFLDYEFRTYGSDVLNYTGLEHEDRPDPMTKVFPKVTKCTFHKYGPSGTVVKHDGLCVLPVNIINEKIFIFIWFWLVFVAVVTGVYLIYRLFTLLAPHLRVFLITVNGGKSCKRSDVEAILDPMAYGWGQKIGDWFLLQLICQNLNPLVVNDLIKHLHKADLGSNSNTETMKLARDDHVTSQV